VMTKEAREQRVKEAKEAYAEDTNQERIPLPWKGAHDQTFPVIKLPVDAVIYNHRSHRIKAQLESHPQRKTVEDDPTGEEAQKVIESILRATEGYEPLTSNLAEVGQRDAGVVTSSGLLVNANTRLAALREIDPHGHIRVAVLPKDATDKDIDQLELSLQIQRDFKQDYSFTNELLFIEDLISIYSYSAEDVAKALNWAASSDEKELKRGIGRVQQSQRILALVRDVQARSDGKLPLTFFDGEKRQALIDLDDKYESLKGKDPDGAEKMREGRLLGILSGNFYRELRKIDAEAVDEHLATKLAEKPTLEGRLEKLVTLAPTTNGGGDTGAGGDDDLDLLDDADISSGDGGVTSTLRPLIELIARTEGEKEIEMPAADGGDAPTKIQRDDLIREVAEAIDEAAEDAGTDTKVKQSLDGPIKAVRDATKKINLAIESYREVSSSAEFDQGKFNELMGTLKTSYDALDKEVNG
jgi:hypothetical protein